MPEQPLHKIWQTSVAARSFSQHFQSHIVALIVNYEDGGKRGEVLFSGFLYSQSNLRMWITAGHVAKEITDIKNGVGGYKITSTKWLDHQGAGYAIPSVSFDIHAQEFFPFEKDGIDLGITFLKGLPLKALEANSKNIFLTETTWRKLKKAKPIGFYLIGIPKELHRISETVGTTGIDRHLHAPVLCLPVEGIPKEEKPSGEFWQYKDSLYWRILPYSDGEMQPVSISFMSGGPILSVQQDTNGQVRYYLFGIQSAWLPESRVIRATKIQILGEVIDGVIRNIKKEMQDSPQD